MDKPASLFPDLEQFIRERIQAGSGKVYSEILAQIERQLLSHVLAFTGGKQNQAAKILGITRGSLRNKIRSLGIIIEHSVNIGEKKNTTTVSDKPLEKML